MAGISKEFDIVVASRYASRTCTESSDSFGQYRLKSAYQLWFCSYLANKENVINRNNRKSIPSITIMQSQLPQLQIYLLQHHHLSVIATAAQSFGHPVVTK